MSPFGFTVPTSGDDDEDRLVGWNRADSNLDQSGNLSPVGDWNSVTENATTQSRTHGSAHEILTAANRTDRYVYASYIDEPIMRASSLSTAKLYYHRNGQYSITALTDATGTIAERYAYDAYGKLTVLDGGGTVLSGSAYGNRYTYTGREWDGELGLYHYRARIYDPESGRFVSRDPIGYVDGMSLYRGYFVGRGVDPLGNQAVNCAALHQECLGCVQETKDDCDLRAHGFCFISCVVGGKRCKGGLAKGGLFTLCYGICNAAYIASCDRQVTNGTTGCNAALAYCNANGEWPGVFWRRWNRVPICF